MMQHTLRDIHRKRRLEELRTRLTRIDEQLQRDELFLTEAFNRQQMAAAIDIVKKLRAIDFGALRTLAQARDAAVNDVTSVLAGTSGQGIVRKVLSMFKVGENPLIDVLAFADAVHNFFDMFAEYAGALSPNDDSLTLASVLTGVDNEQAASTSLRDLPPEKRKLLTDLQKVIINGLKPDGALARVSKTWIDKYLGGRKGLKLLAREMLKLKVSDVNRMASSVGGALKNAAAVGQAAAGASQQAAVQSSATTGTTQAASSSPEKGTKDGRTAADSRSAGARVYDEIKADFGSMDRETVINVIDVLAQNDKLKDE